MKLKNISLLGLVALLLATTFPQTTSAYYTTDQQSKAITNTTALYSITYTFGLPEHDVYLPVITQRNIENNPNNPVVGYSFTPSETGLSTAGTAIGLVVSGAEIVDNMYKVPAGQKKHFTLFVFLTLDENDAKAKYALQVDNLPYLKVDSEGKELQLGMSVGELTRYATKKTGLNK